MTPPQVDVSVLAPVGFVAIGAMLVLMGEVLLSRAKTFLGREVSTSFVGTVLAGVAILFTGLAFYVSCAAFAAGGADAFNPSNTLYQLDRFSALLTAVISLATLLSCALAIAYLDELHINHGEYYALALLASAGMMLMVGAMDMLMLFMGLELMSIPIYVLAGFDRNRLRSNESAMKYFIIGSFASAILLYGIALLYGSAGATSFEAVRAGFDANDPVALIGVGLVVVGFAFKISSVPFHQWTPDVYEGAPSAVTAFMSVTVKAAAVASLMRFVGLALGPLDPTLVNVLWLMAALTMVVGNLMAIIQDNIKRMLAYSSIAHAGYLLVGLVAGTPEGYSAIVFYLIVYTFMNLGAFGVVVALAHQGQECDRIESFAGLARTRPALAALMTLFMMALIGIPGTAGFIAKFAIFSAAVQADVIWLTIIGVLASAVSVYYYLRIPVLMYMQDPAEESPRLEISSGEAVVLGICAFAVLFLGIFPNEGSLPIVGQLQVADWARESVRMLFTAR